MDGREPGAQPRAGSGHRTVPHTADLQVEAWSATAEGCIGEVVRAVVDSFADLSAARPAGERACTVIAASDADLLAGVLEEVIYRMDADGELPAALALGAIRDAEGGRAMEVRFRMADTATAALVGAVPKAVSLHGLDLRAGPGGWTGRVTVDV
ncbi:archease [Kitasatospora aureofaciens]|uniref:archease n=1 Tax=Kitasatospora aureofaciens TaxID=1894 RepID=UPI0037FDD082